MIKLHRALPSISDIEIHIFNYFEKIGFVNPHNKEKYKAFAHDMGIYITRKFFDEMEELLKKTGVDKIIMNLNVDKNLICVSDYFNTGKKRYRDIYRHIEECLNSGMFECAFDIFDYLHKTFTENELKIALYITGYIIRGIFDRSRNSTRI